MCQSWLKFILSTMILIQFKSLKHKSIYRPVLLCFLLISLSSMSCFQSFSLLFITNFSGKTLSVNLVMGGHLHQNVWLSCCSSLEQESWSQADASFRLVKSILASFSWVPSTYWVSLLYHIGKDLKTNVHRWNNPTACSLAKVHPS